MLLLNKKLDFKYKSNYIKTISKKIKIHILKNNDYSLIEKIIFFQNYINLYHFEFINFILEKIYKNFIPIFQNYFIISIDSLGGSISKSFLFVKKGSSIKLPSYKDLGLSKKDRKFSGWKLSYKGKVVYNDCETIIPTEDIKLIVRWTSYGTSDSFNLYSKTIESQYGTSSSLGNLNTNEPDDIEGIENCFDINEVQNTINNVIDSDSAILPKVIISYEKESEMWVIFSCDDEIPTNSSNYTEKESYKGLLDAVNGGKSYLTNGRTTKEKILINCSGSTGDATLNQNSKVNVSNRNNSSVSIQPGNYTILDFGGNTIHVDRGETFTATTVKSGVSYTFTYDIRAFINMERGVHDVSICNLILTGKPTYGIFVAQGYYIYFYNIYIGTAVGETCGASIAIRCQSQATAIANVDISKWSRYLYFDNIITDGTHEHGLETFNAYNVYVGTYIIRDASVGCGILLNCTFNAYIIRIYGIRCCTSGTYAALRLANDAGPNIFVHYIYSEGSGHGLFGVSSSCGVTVDKINFLNSHDASIYVGGSASFTVKSGIIATNGNNMIYCSNDGIIGSVKALDGTANIYVGGSSSVFLPQNDNIMNNIKIIGFKNGFTIRYKMSSNYNIFNNIDISECSGTLLVYSSNGTGPEVPGAFEIVDGKIGPGDDTYAENSEEIINSNYIYRLNEDSTGYIIVKYTGSESELTLPSTFKDLNITQIGDFAFYNNENLISVIIPNNIKIVGDLSFSNCTKLTNVTFSIGGSYEIRHAAFKYCSSLKTLDLTGVTTIRSSAFYECKSLTSVNCPESVIYFGTNCFYLDDIDLIINCTDSSIMTVEPYAFYFMGRNSTITFTGLSLAPSVVGYSYTGSNSYYYYSQLYMENNVYSPGKWAKYFYHCAIPVKYTGSS